MNPLSVVIMLCIGNTAGWLAAMYLPGGQRRLLVHVVVGTFGALCAGALAAFVLPASGTFGQTLAGMAGAATLIAFVHLCDRVLARRRIGATKASTSC